MRTEIYLFLFLLVYFFFVFFLRSYLLWKRTGVNPLTFNKTDDAHGYNGKVFTFISLLELVVVFIYAFKNDYSRNPIFLGIMIANVGLLLIIPNAFTLLIVSLSTTSINTQIRLEEEFLKRSHGEEYENYLTKVKCWL